MSSRAQHHMEFARLVALQPQPASPVSRFGKRRGARQRGVKLCGHPPAAGRRSRLGIARILDAVRRGILDDNASCVAENLVADITQLARYRVTMITLGEI